MRFNLPPQKYEAEGKAANFLQQLETRVASLPGVETVGLITELPLSGQLQDFTYTVEGRPPVNRDQAFPTDFRSVNQNYFSALRIPLLRGRNFSEQEVRQSDNVIVVSQTLVDYGFPE